MTVDVSWKKENNSLAKEFKFSDFSHAIKFVNTVSVLAEEMNHHPDILIHSYNKVNITLSTHSEGEVTNKDYLLAEKIDKII